MINNTTVSFNLHSQIDTWEWNTFIHTVDESTFFCSTDYLHSQDNVIFLAIRNEQGKLIAGLPFRIYSLIPLFRSFYKVAWSDSSVLVSNNFSQEESYLLKRQAISVLLDHLRLENVVFFNFSTKLRSKDADLFAELGFKNSKHATFIIDLTKEESEITKNFSKGNKSSITKAKKAGVEITILNGHEAVNRIPYYLTLQEKTKERAIQRNSDSVVLTKSKKFLNSILLSTTYNTYMALAYYNNQLAASAIIVSNNQTIFYYLGGSDYNLTKISNATNLLHLEIIKFAKSNGFKSYDLGGTLVNPKPDHSTYGVYVFKKGFGGELSIFDNALFIIKAKRYSIFQTIKKNKSIVRFFYNFFK